MQKYFPKGYKETLQKDFLYHCLKCFSQVFGTFWLRYRYHENKFQEMLLQGFTNRSRNFSRELSLQKHFLKYYGKVSKTFLKKIFYKTENVKNISETLQKYFTKGYKEPFQKDFLYHCLKFVSKVVATF